MKNVWKYAMVICFLVLIMGGVSSEKVLAETTYYTSGYYTYKISSNGKAIITDVNEDINGDIMIPSTLGGYPVSGIDSVAFANCELITSAVVPDTISYINREAFKNCSNLKKINLPNGLTEIAMFTFSNCHALTEIVIPEKVTRIGMYAFNYCISLSEVTIPESVKIIDTIAFGGCANLRKVVLPKEMNSIGESAFANCTSLREITIPNRIKVLMPGIFKDCTSLSKVVIPESVTHIGTAAFGNCTNLREIILPNSLEKIDQIAFANCVNLSEIIIPANVKIIDISAFSNCVNLRKAVIKGSSTKIGLYGPNLIIYCCENSNAHEYVVRNGYPYILIDATVSQIELFDIQSQNVVYSDTSTKLSGTITTTTVETLSSERCLEEISKITWSSTDSSIIDVSEITCTDIKIVDNYSASFKINVIPKKLGTVTITGKTSNGISASCTLKVVGKCGDSLFWEYENGKLIISGTGAMYDWNINNNKYAPWHDLKITEVIISDGATSIGEYAFSGCKNLVNVTMPETIKAIGLCAFYDCDKLKRINSTEDENCIKIPEEVVAIGNQAFAHCGEMTSVIVPNSVTSIGSNIFADCIKLKTATLSKNLTSTGKHTFNSCSSLTTVALPTGIKCIDTNAFANCTGLKSITLPVSITKIEYQAFVNDTLLDNITIPDNVVTISNKAFSNCPEVRICGYADSYAETYAKNMNIPFVEMALTLNDVWGFENPSGNMQLKHFSKFLNPMYSVLAFGTDTGDGLCYGMVVSAVAISEHNSPPVSSMHYTSGEGVKVLHDVTVEDEVLCILDADDQNYIGVWVCDYIRYAYVYQRTPIAGVEERQNLNKLNSLYYGVRYSVEKNKDPIEIMIRGTYGKKDAGHELLAFGIAKDDSDMTEILVYDCNTPQRLQSLYLNKTAGLYTGWSYSPGYIDWGTGDKYAEISFSTISDDFIKDVFADKEDMKALLDYQNLISVKSNIKNAKSSDGVNHDLSNDKDFLEVKSNNVLLGSEAYISNDRKLYWAKDIGEMTFENDSKENEIIIANMTNMIKANIAPNAVLKINVGEKMEDSYAKIENLSANSQFTIGYTNCINDKLYETNISGLASDTVITEVSNSAIIVKGADELEVYTTADDVMLEKIQIDTNNDSVKIVQDNDGLMDVYADKNNDGIYEKKLQSVSVSINPYEDVVKTDWFYSATQYTYYKGLMTGMDATHFSPYAPLSRAQFALILYRIEGSPSYETDKSFKDITGDEWYGEAVLWAADKGIVTGYMDGNFGPADMITREQMAVMMYRYAKYLGENVNNSTEFSGFKDAASVSSFATEAMQWAVGEGVITGKENATMLDPQGNTARCEAAVIIQRFME